MDASGSEPQLHRCRLCHRLYKRAEHLKRHYASHGTHRPHVCKCCSRSFQRSDALKRHQRTCNISGSRTSSLFARRRACDRCVRMKKACDGDYPCQTCSDRDADCAYSMNIFPTHVFNERKDSAPSRASSAHASTAPTGSVTVFDPPIWADLTDPDLFDFSSTTWDDFLSMPPSVPVSGSHVDDTVPTLRFLENFTKCTGLVSSFDCGSHEQREQVFDHAEQLHLPHALIVDPADLEKSSRTDLLSLKSSEILELVKGVATVKPRNSSVDLTWSSLLEDTCSQFFAPANLRKFIELYWLIWHPNVNLVHRPTFDATSSKAVLVAAMVIIGACVSPAPSDRANAATWLNCVEEIVFTDDDFCDDVFDNTNAFPNHAKVQALQAAYIVCLYQNWEGSDKSKRRIRRHRFSTLVAVARDIGIERARHSDYTNRLPSEFDWIEFSTKEELIRVLLWTFLLDTAFVIFNNVPPRMVIKEMKMNMASCEAVFQAPNAHKCYNMLRDFGTDTVKHKGAALLLHSATECMRMDEMEPWFCRALANQGPLNLFVITSALHSMIFQYQNSFGSEGQLIPIRNALENWKSAWTLYMTDYASSRYHLTLRDHDEGVENMWKRIGFVRHASEYWLLASLMLDRIHDSETRDLANTNDANLQNPNTTTISTEDEAPVLQKYDETSMRQVNDLIADFQRTKIG